MHDKSIPQDSDQSSDDSVKQHNRSMMTKNPVVCRNKKAKLTKEEKEEKERAPAVKQATRAKSKLSTDKKKYQEKKKVTAQYKEQARVQSEYTRTFKDYYIYIRRRKKQYSKRNS